MDTFRRFSSLGRSLRLLASFRFEQTDPARFYGPLAADTAQLIEILAGGVRDKTVVDIGGGPGYFHREFSARGAHYVTVEPDAGEMSAAGIEVPASVRGDGMALPLRDGCADVVYSSNVAEHVPRPWDMGREMIRVARPGGLVVLSYTVWLGPFGGHETGLWPHYVGGAFARDRYTRRHGHPPKNVFGTSLFDVSCAEGLRWGRAQPDADLLLAFPRYHPWWAWWLVRVPLLREFAVSNLVLVLRRH
ncbi:class I SAM-dependent methyltransferase [Corynebacterium uropygiale]|uniref:Class I SAM-dependent methyltransferase n=1 Tax=Corynebacterium uropygiale TaxID=1775911 RepID=A0A9X1QT38_9CORY|nr:class I SAM-dependent methyltransferase [Corynebacterium uropygiale]MCF4007313.1 class I SAM-dependent methyltransferase [Corynebacterium uropygiale]